MRPYPDDDRDDDHLEKPAESLASLEVSPGRYHARIGRGGHNARLQGSDSIGEVVYVSRVAITRERHPLRQAELPPAKNKVTFGVHSAVADHYGVDSENFPPDATALDYVVAAAGG